jgi:hypothetical protein
MNPSNVYPFHCCKKLVIDQPMKNSIMEQGASLFTYGWGKGGFLFQVVFGVRKVDCPFSLSTL